VSTDKTTLEAYQAVTRLLRHEGPEFSTPVGIPRFKLPGRREFYRGGSGQMAAMMRALAVEEAEQRVVQSKRTNARREERGGSLAEGIDAAIRICGAGDDATYLSWEIGDSMPEERNVVFSLYGDTSRVIESTVMHGYPDFKLKTGNSRVPASKGTMKIILPRRAHSMVNKQGESVRPVHFYEQCSEYGVEVTGFTQMLLGSSVSSDKATFSITGEGSALTCTGTADFEVTWRENPYRVPVSFHGAFNANADVEIRHYFPITIIPVRSEVTKISARRITKGGGVYTGLENGDELISALNATDLYTSLPVGVRAKGPDGVEIVSGGLYRSTSIIPCSGLEYDDMLYIDQHHPSVVAACRENFRLHFLKQGFKDMEELISPLMTYAELPNGVITVVDPRLQVTRFVLALCGIAGYPTESGGSFVPAMPMTMAQRIHKNIPLCYNAGSFHAVVPTFFISYAFRKHIPSGIIAHGKLRKAFGRYEDFGGQFVGRIASGPGPVSNDEGEPLEDTIGAWKFDTGQLDLRACAAALQELTLTHLADKNSPYRNQDDSVDLFVHCGLFAMYSTAYMEGTAVRKVVIILQHPRKSTFIPNSKNGTLDLGLASAPAEWFQSRIVGFGYYSTFYDFGD